jgi:hypothetical protein
MKQLLWLTLTAESAVAVRRAILIQLLATCRIEFNKLMKDTTGCKHGGLCSTLKLGALVRALQSLGATAYTTDPFMIDHNIEDAFMLMQSLDEDLTDWELWSGMADDVEEAVDFETPCNCKEGLCKIELDGVKLLSAEYIRKESGELEFPIPQVLLQKLAERAEL